MAMTLEALRQLTQEAVAIRGKATLDPAGGPSDKVFPPTHSVKEGQNRYALETRRIDGETVQCVLLDSVQSQANRMEEALQSLWADRQISLPVVAVDFGAIAPEVGMLTSLTAPHRVSDALLRDSMLGDTLFRLSPLGKSFTDATPRYAAPLFKICPTALVFGLWDSTGPKGGLGSKFARSLVSEIVGIGAVSGAKTASRIDPTGIVTKAGEVLEAKDPNQRWTLDPNEARVDKKGKVVKVGDGKVSEVNHSNIPPTIDLTSGGVTVDRIEHSVVLSLAALRKLSFGKADTEARTVLAALGLLAVVASEARGHDLRSRCLLIPRKGQALKLESMDRFGECKSIDLDLNGAVALFKAAVDALPPELKFDKQPGEPLATLTPSEKLASLITKSRELAAAGADVEAE
ncbi:MAG: type I-U CRISPR-associated protein Cas7 [Myxococcus sp.]|nr:type I-U CRISPR-associated protein Cas7 [Myxococcus sp.]